MPSVVNAKIAARGKRIDDAGVARAFTDAPQNGQTVSETRTWRRQELHGPKDIAPSYPVSGGLLTTVRHAPMTLNRRDFSAILWRDPCCIGTNASPSGCLLADGWVRRVR
jgi:hypothetical protein